MPKFEIDYLNMIIETDACTLGSVIHALQYAYDSIESSFVRDNLSNLLGASYAPNVHKL